MSLKRLVSKYIVSAEKVFSEIEITETCACVNVGKVRKVIEFAKAYLQDAKYYSDKKRFEVRLTSVAYCEGLLDALKLLGAVRFKWPMKREEKSEE